MYTIDKNDNVVYNREVNFKGWRKMKLRSKETGEIIPAEAREDGIYLFDKTTEQWNKYELSLLAEYWEYCGEPKEYWYIDDAGVIQIEQVLSPEINMRKSIGNYFETKEEAEKAVEKIKAYKRLKDKGFKFVDGWLDKNDDFIIKAKLGQVGLIDQPDVHLLFGGEE